MNYEPRAMNYEPTAMNHEPSAMNHEPIFYRILENPKLYGLCQQILGPGGEKDLMGEIHSMVMTLPSSGRILDVGCGPHSWLWQEGLHPVGLDISISYSQAFRDRKEPAVTGSATALPFHDGAFDGVWSVGLLHHLPENLARQAVVEMVRVTDPSGYCLIFDAALPEPAWRRPIAHLIRKLDRGGFMRTQEALMSLLPGDPWIVKRFSYSWWGLEGAFCLHFPSTINHEP